MKNENKVWLVYFGDFHPGLMHIASTESKAKAWVAEYLVYDPGALLSGKPV